MPDIHISSSLVADFPSAVTPAIELKELLYIRI